MSTPAALEDPRPVWRNPDFLFGAVFDFVVQRERLAQPFNRAMWGSDARLIYDRMRATIGAAEDGTAILDVPCGGGTAFRGLRPGQRVRYVAADIAPAMLDRARRNADRRGLRQIDFVEADVQALPFEDASFDLVMCFNSLHNFPDPARALAEMGRCLRAGGAFVADCAVLGAGRRFDALIRAFQRFAVFGPGGAEEDYLRWMADAGLVDVRAERSGGLTHFTAHRAA